MTLDELIQALNNSSADAREVLSKLRELLLVNGDVNFNLADGTVITAPSLPKLRQQYWDNMNSVMSRTYYVDAVNGDDSNPGTADAPFRTIKKAVDSVPVGGYGEIVLSPGQTFWIGQDAEEFITIVNKAIYLKGDRDNRPHITTSAMVSNDFNSFRGQIDLYGGCIFFEGINFSLPSRIDPLLPWSNRKSLICVTTTYGGPLLCGMNYCTIEVQDGNSLLRCHVAANLLVSCYEVSLQSVDGSAGYLVARSNEGNVILGTYLVTVDSNCYLLDSGAGGVVTNYSGTSLHP